MAFVQVSQQVFFFTIVTLNLLYMYRQLCSCFSNTLEKQIDHMQGSMSSCHIEKPACKPVDHVLFLKTHKTGSSTMTNILNRYGDFNNLIFALPWDAKLYSFYWPLRFSLKFVGGLGRGPNILCNHARYSKGPMNWLLPKDSSRYVTIIREPTQHFESIFNFFKLGYRMGLKNYSFPLDRFLRNPAFYFGQLKSVSGSLNLAKNPLLFELGLDTARHENMTVVRRYIDFLNEEFDLVMIMEYYDESLVLLKRLLCWEIEDILHFKLNGRREKEKQPNVSKRMRERILKWNSGDSLLYTFFNRTFWKMIEEQGPDFYNDLEVFRKEKEDIKNKCLRKGHFLTKSYAGRFVQGYELKKNISKDLSEVCDKMIMNEIPYMEYLREKMMKELTAIDNSKNVPDLTNY